ncbi:hypothetical protein [uncultured Winogradskyella sp.]|uniref:hypothetical protein n=1 Tax=uncultured Winogradskyella sp. TaxID=395353 RepID=UPI0035132696
MKKFLALLGRLMLILSCSSDDNDEVDRIVGKWQMTARFESGVEVEVGCSQCTFTEYKSNGRFGGDYIDLQNTPDECATLTFTELLWSRVGVNNYNFGSGDNVFSTGYFEGENLLVEPVDLPYQWVYSRLD